MKLSHLCKYNNWSPTYEILCLLQSPNVHCRIHKSRPTFPVMNQINPIHTITDYFITSILIWPSQTLVHIFHLSHACYMPHPVSFPSLHRPNIWWRALIMNLFIMKFYPAFIISNILSPHIILSVILNPLAPNIIYTQCSVWCPTS